MLHARQQQIVDDGLHYNRFHTTALCSPTRQALAAEEEWIKRGRKMEGEP